MVLVKLQIGVFAFFLFRGLGFGRNRFLSNRLVFSRSGFRFFFGRGLGFDWRLGFLIGSPLLAGYIPGL